jgi:FSR family fosmidomycin resistance protein-like MFS transporter
VSAPAFDTNQRKVLRFTGVAHAATHYSELMFPTLAVQLAIDTAVPLEQVLTWSFAGYLLFGLGALPAGLVADRIGSRRVILIGLATSGAFALLAATAAPGMSLVLCLAGIGLSASLYHPAGMGMLSRCTDQRGRALAINGIYGNVGIAATPLTTALLASQFGWRGAFAISGAALLGAALCFVRTEIDERPVVAANAVDDEAPHEARRRIAGFSVLCVAAMLGGIAYRANTLVQPALFSERVDWIGYGLATSLVFVFGIAGQYIGGMVADRRDLRWSYLGYQALSLPALFAIPWLFGAPLLMASGLYVFFALGMQPVENSLYASLTPERWRSTAYGIKFILVFGVGSSAVWIVRFATEAWGLASVYFVMLGVVGLMGSVIGLLIWVTRVPDRRSPRQSAPGAAAPPVSAG